MGEFKIEEMINTNKIISFEQFHKPAGHTCTSHLAHAVVSQFDVAIAVQQDIVKFEITIYDTYKEVNKIPVSGRVKGWKGWKAKTSERVERVESEDE